MVDLISIKRIANGYILSESWAQPKAELNIFYPTIAECCKSIDTVFGSGFEKALAEVRKKDEALRDGERKQTEATDKQSA